MKKYRIVKEGALFIVEARYASDFIPFMQQWRFVGTFGELEYAKAYVIKLINKEFEKKNRKVVWP